MASKWQRMEDDGEVFYYNEETGESRWSKPGWSKVTDEDGDTVQTLWTSLACVSLCLSLRPPPHPECTSQFYYNDLTDETVWERPADMSASDGESDGAASNAAPPAPSPKHTHSKAAAAKHRSQTSHVGRAQKAVASPIVFQGSDSDNDAGDGEAASSPASSSVAGARARKISHSGSGSVTSSPTLKAKKQQPLKRRGKPSATQRQSLLSHATVASIPLFAACSRQDTASLAMTFELYEAQAGTAITTQVRHCVACARPPDTTAFAHFAHFAHFVSSQQ